MGENKTPKKFRMLGFLGLVFLLGFSLGIKPPQTPSRFSWCSKFVDRMPQAEFQPQFAPVRIWAERSGLHLKYRTRAQRQFTESHLIIATSIRGLPSTERGLEDCRLMVALESISYDYPKIH